MAELEYNELLVLNTLLGYDIKFSENKTVADLIKDIEANHDSKMIEMTLDESKAFIQAAKLCIERNKEFGNYRIVNSRERERDANGYNTIAPIVTFANGDDAVVVFWGTTSADEWYDNFIAGHESVDGSSYQNAALDYINEVDSKYKNITVTGHSKGGNKAQYVALKSDRVDRCVAFDGQGFSKAFIDDENNAELINKNKGKITLISSDHDIVNAMLFDVAGEVLYVDSSDLPREYLTIEATGKYWMMYHHKPSILLNADGYLYNYEGVQPAPIVGFVSDFSEYMSSIDDVDARQKVFEFVATIAKMKLGPDQDDDGIRKMLLDVENTEEVAIFLAYTFEFAESNGLTYDDMLTILGDVGVESEQLKAWYMPILWDALFDASNSISADEFIELCNSIAERLKQNGINSWDGFIAYIGEDPLRIISLYASLDLEKKTVHKAISNFLSLENIAALIAGFAKENPVITAITMTALSVPATRELVFALGRSVVIGVLICITVNHILKNWDKICSAVGKAVEYVMDEISKFFSELRNRINAGINNFVSDVFERAERMLTAGAKIINTAIDGTVGFLQAVKDQAVSVIKAGFFVCNPLLYLICSKIYNETKQPVTINVTKLRNCVDTLNRLARRVAEMDDRLDNLYSRLSQSNIEQGEGFFTSLANLYNLFRADLNVDQGAAMKRNARALSELFEGYETAARITNSNVPQRI